MNNIEGISAELQQQEQYQKNPLEQAVAPQRQETNATPLTQHERFLAFIRRGRFNDLDENITRPNYHFDIMGTQCTPAYEIVAVTGKPGAGKSTAFAIMMGVAIGRTEFAGIRCLHPCKKVLWIDTEKGEFTCKQKMKIFRRIAGIGDDLLLEDVGIHFYLMRGETIEDRLYFIEELSKMEQYDIIVIDGIFDLTDDADKNHTPVMELLKRLASRKSSVFAMLHTNKNDNNMRYALGTELQRLCTTRFTVDFKGGVHTITHEKSNDTSLAPPVTFMFDKDGNVISCLDVAKNNRIRKLTDLMIKAFGDNGEMAYTDLIESIMSVTNMSKSTADRRFNEAKELYILRVTPDGAKYTIISPTVTSTPL